MGEILLYGLAASIRGGLEPRRRLGNGAERRRGPRTASGRKRAGTKGEGGFRDAGTSLRAFGTRGKGWFCRQVLVSLALTVAFTANADDYTGRTKLKRDGWERLNVLAVSLNSRCFPEENLIEQIEKRFAPTKITPLIAGFSDYAPDDRFVYEKWHEHIQDELYLKVGLGCVPEIGDWGVVLGFVVHAKSEWYKFDRNSGSFRSWGHGNEAFGEAGRSSIGALVLDYLTVLMGTRLDEYLEANLGSKEAVIAHRGEYPREKKITGLWGPIGAKNPH